MSFEMHYKIQILFRYCNSTHTRRDEIGKEIEFKVPGKKTNVYFLAIGDGNANKARKAGKKAK